MDDLADLRGWKEDAPILMEPVGAVVNNGNGKGAFSWRRVAICAMAWGTVMVMVVLMGPDFDPEETILLANTLIIAAGLSGYAVNTWGKEKAA